MRQLLTSAFATKKAHSPVRCFKSLNSLPRYPVVATGKTATTDALYMFNNEKSTFINEGYKLSYSVLLIICIDDFNYR